MLEELKKDVIKVAIECDERRLTNPKTGNFSARDPETGYFVMTPTGCYKEDMVPDDILVLDLDLNIIENINNRGLSVAAAMHACCYKNRADAMGVVHTHSKFTSVFGAMGKEIPNVHNDALHYGARTIVVPYNTTDSQELLVDIEKALPQTDFILIEKLGTLTVANSVRKALTHAIHAEQVAEVAVMLKLYTGKEPDLIPLEQYEKQFYHRS